MDGYGLDPTAARASAGHVQMTAKARLGRWFAALPDRMRTYLPVAILVGVWAGVLIWEMANTIDGFARIWPERGVLVWIIGAACPLGFMIAYRMAAEGFRAKHFASAFGFSVVSTLLFVVVLFGTFSNFVAETQVAGKEAREINDTRQILRDEIRRMDRELVSMPEPVSLEADTALLDARLAEAVGWDMPNLDVVAPVPVPDDYAGAACVADLKPRPRFLCNEATAIRDDIIRGQAMKDAKEKLRVAIEGKERELATMQIAEAGAQYDAMAGMLAPGELAAEDRQRLADFLSSWALLIIALIFLISDAIFGDYLLERRERKEL
jgi:hypothetical protein